MEKNFYEILEITEKEKNLPNDDFLKILKSNYKRLARTWHPDKFATKSDSEKAEAELGDLLFSIINVARMYKIHPDNALEKTNRKFMRRFNYVEEKAIEQGKNLKDMTLEEMDALWDEAKRNNL
jgi:uncharacterized protein YabN with tetrapyrrole methylase and pyrophosphatase domain